MSCGFSRGSSSILSTSARPSRCTGKACPQWSSRPADANGGSLCVLCLDWRCTCCVTDGSKARHELVTRAKLCSDARDYKGDVISLITMLEKMLDGEN